MNHTLRQNFLIYFSEVPALMTHFSGNYLLDIGGVGGGPSGHI